MSSIKKNIILNLANTLTGLLVPIITFPYAARILLPEGIGIVNFQQSIINYIILFTSIGIPLYGVREIAKCRDNVNERNKATIEIISLSLLLSLVGYILVFALGYFVERINCNVEVFYILSISVLFTALGVEWFYKAIEDFRFITIRAIIFRLISAISLFLFVNTKEDILIYSLIIVTSSVGNNIANFVHLRKYLKFDLKTYRLDIKKHIKPAFAVFVLNVVISLYTQLNTIMIGFMGNDEMVGYYSAGNKISHIALTAVASISTVLLPRFASLYSTKNEYEIRRLSQLSYHLISAFSIPMIVVIIIIARQITLLFLGEAYLSAISVLAITSPIIFFIALSNLLGIQILYPQGKEKIVIYSTLVGAFINIFLNFILIPRFYEDGAAISTCIAEIAVVCTLTYNGRKFIKINYLSKNIILYIMASIIMAIPMLLSLQCVDNILIQSCVSVLLGTLTYVILLILFKDQVAEIILKNLKLK